MTSQTPDMQSVFERLENLERQNRRLKQATAVAFIIVSSMVLLAQTTTNRTLEATAFVLKDADGKVKGRLAVVDGYPKFCLYGSGDEKSTVASVELSINPFTGPYLIISGKGETGNMAYLQSNRLTISDEKRFSSVLGVTNTRNTHTGEEHQTSAASLTFFNEKENVIWQVP
jgi:hypothetical protein